MFTRLRKLPIAASILFATSAVAAPVHFQTNYADGLMAMASHPPAYGVENEAGDDFILTATTRLTHATFTGLLPAGTPSGSISQVVVEIYRVFPFDSTNPPSGHVPARTNSPSDNAFDSRDSGSAGLSYTTAVLNTEFFVLNSVRNGIHPTPGQTTGGEGMVNGDEVLFDVNFDQPILLPAGHYFFVPQVALTYGDFYWLSSQKPVVAPGTPFAPDLQAWIRNTSLAPDWLRVGTDIVGGTTPPTFNGTFSLDGDTANTVHFQTNDPDGRIAIATRPPAAGVLENEAGDDFVLTDQSRITHATFTGMIPGTALLSDVNRVAVEIYRVFPFDSDTIRTITVPTRTNSPADNALDTRDSTVAAGLTYTPIVLNATFAAANSVRNGIHPSPNQTTGGEGAVSGQEVLFDVVFDPPFSLPSGHYFFVPQVGLTSGDFYWLSTQKPIVAPGTPFTGDLQAWIRNEDLAPDWLRIGSDIVGGATPPTFNATFSLDGDTDVVFRDHFE